jgi:hybrid cluster-associated redox disulfide protein
MMMLVALPTQDMTVAEVLETWPETVEAFQTLKTACVGCVMAPFDTLADVARIYELELATIMQALHQAIQADPASQSSSPAVDADSVD